MNDTDLAGRYRKLLAWYPRDHRERHGEEMLGVLLAGAGQRTRPSRGETTDLLLGALRLHLRRVVGADGGIDHRDVLSIVSLLGPIVLLAGSAPVLEILHAWARTGVAVWGWHSTEAAYAPVWGVWAAVAVLSLCRLRRTAAVGAWLGTIGFGLGAAFGYTFFWDTMVVIGGWAVFGALVALALTFSPGPARGWELVGRARAGVLVVAIGASVALVMKSFGTYGVLYHPMNLWITQYGVGMLVLWLLALAVLAAGAVVAAGMRTREGRRAALVLCVPAMTSLVLLLAPRDTDLLVVAAVGFGVPLVVLIGSGSLPRRVRLG